MATHVNLFSDLLKTEGGPSPDLVDPEASLADPLADFLEKTQSEQFHKPVAVSNVRWDSPLGKAAAMVSDRRTERFEKACAVIRKVFQSSPELATEAIDLAKKMLAEERAAILVAAS